MKSVVLVFILLSLSCSYQNAQAEPSPVEHTCAADLGVFESAKTADKELRRIARERKKLEGTATTLEQELAVKEATFLRYEYGIRSWLDDSPSRNIAAAVIAYLGPPIDIGMRTSVENSCYDGMVRDGISVPWASFCEKNNEGDPQYASRLWETKFSEDGSIDRSVCASIEFVNPANRMQHERYFGDNFGHLRAYDNRHLRCTEGVAHLAQSKKDLMTTKDELADLQVRLDCLYLLDQKIRRGN